MSGTESGKAKSCTGILYYSSALKMKGSEAFCFGRRGTVVSEVPHKEILEKSAKKVTKEKEEVNFSYACLGYSQTTEKMEREGTLPLCDLGMRFTVLRAAKPKIEIETDKDKEDSQQAEKEDSALNGRPLSESLRPTIEKYFNSASNFWKRALTNFPTKFYEFQSKFLTSMKKQANYLGKVFSRFSKQVAAWWIPRS